MIQPEILYEDAQLIICYKPAGIATQTKKTGAERHGEHTFKSRSAGRNRTAVYRCSPSAGPASGRRDGVCKNKTGGSKIVGTGKRPFLWEKILCKSPAAGRKNF